MLTCTCPTFPKARDYSFCNSEVHRQYKSKRLSLKLEDRRVSSVCLYRFDSLFCVKVRIYFTKPLFFHVIAITNDGLVCESLQAIPLDVKSWHTRMKFEFSVIMLCEMTFQGEVVSIQLCTVLVSLTWTSCSLLIRTRNTWNDWATALQEAVLENTAMLLYKLTKV